MGKAFYLEVWLWADTTVKNMRQRLTVHGSHDEKAWPDPVNQDVIHTLGPIAFLSYADGLTDGPRKEIVCQHRQERGLLPPHLTYSQIMAYARSHNLDYFREMENEPQLGLSEYSDSAGLTHHPMIQWEIDPVGERVKLTVKCWIEHYKALEYLEDVLKPLLEDFSTCTLKIIPPVDLDDMPEDLRTHYRKMIRVIDNTLPDDLVRNAELHTPQTYRDVLTDGLRIASARDHMLDRIVPGQEPPAADAVQPAAGTTRPTYPRPYPWETFIVGEPIKPTLRILANWERLQQELSNGVTQTPSPARHPRSIEQAKSVKYGTERDLTYDDVKGIVTRAKAWQAQGGKLPAFYVSLGLDETGPGFFTLETLRKYVRDPSFE